MPVGSHVGIDLFASLGVSQEMMTYLVYQTNAQICAVTMV